MEFSRICIGGMRFSNRQSAAEVIKCAVDSGFNYIDVGPCYCYQSEEENSETWIGDAVNTFNLRNKIMLSAKCAVGNGGMGMGEFRPESGFGAEKKEQFIYMFNQSLKRMNVDFFDWYHLWAAHTEEQLEACMKPGGWLEGAMELKDKWKHLGVTTHGENDLIMKFADTGKFEAVTLPLNLINTTRLRGVEYCLKKGITVIAMNPFAGGFLTEDEKLKEYALRYLLLKGVHPLVGFSSKEEVEYAKNILDTMDSFKLTAEEILEEVNDMLQCNEPRCTACGYCSPCPQNINIGASLSYYNLFKYMNMDSAKKAFIEKQWEEGLQLNKCVKCGLCEKRCPNGLKVVSIIEDAVDILYGK
jgi:predicted aldo/keto reductase-like oxidoreductase